MSEAVVDLHDAPINAVVDFMFCFWRAYRGNYKRNTRHHFDCAFVLMTQVPLLLQYAVSWAKALFRVETKITYFSENKLKTYAKCWVIAYNQLLL